MKALVYTGPEAMEFRDAPDPVAGDGEALLKIDRVGICGSDMHGFLGHDDRRPAPLILGHEAAGTIVGGSRDGERVAVNPLVTCRRCRYCVNGLEHLCPKRQIISMPPREGAFAEWLTMPHGNFVAVPDDMPFAKAALAEPLAVCWHAAKLGLRVLGGDAEVALVFGGGAIGLGTALCLRALGVEDVALIEPNEARRAFVEDRCGIMASAAADGITDVDLVADAVGYDATRAAATAAVRPGGAVVHIGLGHGAGGLDVRRMTLQEIAVVGSYCYTMAEFKETVAAMSDGRLGALDWGEERALADGFGAFQDIRAGRVAAPKIVLVPGG
ncbi:MAG: alcohol dehydrogenase catalytic domain-containing protein [Pseudomonadota bacterium]